MCLTTERVSMWTVGLRVILSPVWVAVSVPCVNVCVCVARTAENPSLGVCGGSCLLSSSLVGRASALWLDLGGRWEGRGPRRVSTRAHTHTHTHTKAAKLQGPQTRAPRPIFLLCVLG